METLNTEILYLYCVTDKEPDFRDVIDLVNDLHFVHHKGLYAVVSKVKESEFSEDNLKYNPANLEWIKGKAIIHEKILEGIMKSAGLVPFKFAALFNDTADLKSYLDIAADELCDNIRKLRNKEEWGIKIYCDKKKLADSLIRTDEELLRTGKEVSSSSPGRAFILKKKNEELLNVTVNERMNTLSQCSFDILKEQSLKAQINKLLPGEVTERNDDMILNSAFLVDKNKVASFINTAHTLKEQYKDTGLFVDCTGPWPPYNFCGPAKEISVNG